MDFVDFSGVVLSKMGEARCRSAQAREIGQPISEICAEVFDSLNVNQDENPQDALRDVLHELERLGMVETESSGLLHKISQQGLQMLRDPVPFWQLICSRHIEPDQEALLRLVNRMSHRPDGSYGSIYWVEQAELIAGGWAQPELLWSVASELGRLGLVELRNTMGPIRLHSTYVGLVWERKRAFTLESTFIDSLLDEGETTSVEFKQELHLDTPSQKAEFVKDVLGLVNTKASGRRWLLVGFHDKTHQYSGAPDSRVTRDRMEDILSHYTSPAVEIRYEVVDHRSGRVGKLEVLRDPRNLPYVVAEFLGSKATGDKKQIRKGDIFVRHGTHTVLADPSELSDLQEEREQARN
jgi:hypothetical protein